MSDPQDMSEDEALAAEYVLRLLDAEAERAFKARLDQEPALREQVIYWEVTLADMAEDLPEVIPDAALRAKVMSTVGTETPQRAVSWAKRWFALPSFAVVALVALFVFGPLGRTPAFDPTLHATLISEDGTLHIEAGYAPNGLLFKVIPERVTPAPGRAMELWVIGARGEAPVSLGVIPTDQEITFEISAEIAALIDGGVLAVSDEPAGAPHRGPDRHYSGDG
ncbi:anti-sigma factor [Arenibacterium sp. LLYu02]|uniref:anti-sigma factor n=1 Tax=Arenibacterium sp. LLYu02 TaxID=3404132 RepID=UPI003B20C06C